MVACRGALGDAIMLNIARRGQARRGGRSSRIDLPVHFGGGPIFMGALAVGSGCVLLASDLAGYSTRATSSCLTGTSRTFSGSFFHRTSRRTAAA